MQLTEKDFEEDIEIIAGQDHTYYLYSNKRDLYLSTDISVRKSEEKLKRFIIGKDIKPYCWHDVAFDI